jgi:hypothetical protein
MKQKILAAALMFGANMAQAADPLMGNRKTRVSVLIKSLFSPNFGLL